MTFLGIGPGELFLLLIIVLVVVGPERLPGFARQFGKTIVGLRNWIQRSPDAQLFLRARDELELELRTIRDDLSQEMESVRLEMQNVREEMIQATREATIDAAKQIDEAAIAAREATDTAISPLSPAPDTDSTAELGLAHPPESDGIAPISEPPSMAESAIDAPDAAEAEEFTSAIAELGADEISDEIPRTIAPPRLLEQAEAASAVAVNGQPQPVARSSKPGAPPPAPDATRVEIDELRQQLSRVTDELRDLHSQLRALQAKVALADSEPAAPEPQEVS
jgi:sec-independent protein translocase protein TatB